jgi:Flp pilus assembly protein TadD
LRRPESFPVADAHSNLAMAILQKGDRAGAEAKCRLGLAQMTRLFSEEHPFVANQMRNLGRILMLRGEYKEAMRLMRRALEIE